MTPSRALRGAALVLLLAGLGTLAFWAVFFADLDSQRTGPFAQQSASWYDWERSFVLPDLWLAVTALLAARALWRRERHGLPLALVCSGGLVFLGLIDVAFFLQHGLYTPLTGEAALELGIHAGALLAGVFVSGATWWGRAALGGPGAAG